MSTPWHTLNTSSPPHSRHAPEVVGTVPSAEMLDAEHQGLILILADIDSRSAEGMSCEADQRG